MNGSSPPPPSDAASLPFAAASSELPVQMASRRVGHHQTDPPDRVSSSLGVSANGRETSSEDGGTGGFQGGRQSTKELMEGPFEKK